MKSVRLHGTGDLRIYDEPNPIAGDREKLIRVKAVGICGSHLHGFSEGEIGDAKLERPLISGCECAGIMEDGRRVAIDPAFLCGHCEFCERGYPNLCANIIFAGHGKHDGASREYASYPTRCLFPLPDSFTHADGAMLEPLDIAIHTIYLGKIKAGMIVSVFGGGPIGIPLLILSFLSAALQRQLTVLFARHSRIINIIGSLLLISVAIYDLSKNWDLLRLFFKGI